MATRQDKLNPQPTKIPNAIQRNDGVKKELSVSVTPCCFNLAEAGEKESTFEICNKNQYPLYFRLLATNSHAMNFHPLSGRLNPLSKVTVRGHHVQSARPIGYQQKLAIMTSRLPLEEWPDQEHYQPIMNDTRKHDSVRHLKTKSSSESDRQKQTESKSRQDPEFADYPSAHFARYEHHIVKKPRKHMEFQDSSSDQHRNNEKTSVRPEKLKLSGQHHHDTEDRSHSCHRCQKKDEDRETVEVSKVKESLTKSRKIHVVCHCGECRGFYRKLRKGGDHFQDVYFPQKKNLKVKGHKSDRSHGGSSDSTDFSHDPEVITRVKESRYTSSSNSASDNSAETDPCILTKCNRMLKECNTIRKLTKANFILILLLFLIVMACIIYIVYQNHQGAPHCYEHPWLLYNFCSK